jgi:hypothetical protein
MEEKRSMILQPLLFRRKEATLTSLRQAWEICGGEGGLQFLIQPSLRNSMPDFLPELALF